MKTSWVAGLFVCAFFSTWVANAQDEVFKTDAVTKVQYRFIKHDAKGVKPVEGDIAHVVMIWTGKNAKGDADSVYGDSRQKGGDSSGTIPIPLHKSFNGCLEQGIMMMAKGDSAIFKVNADSLFVKTFHLPENRLPKYITGTSIFTFKLKLVSFQTQEEVNAAKQQEMQKRSAKLKMMKDQEPSTIGSFIAKNNPNVKPDADSIFYLKTVKGTGQHVMEGDSLEIKYKGSFLDGKVFDQSDKGTGPGTFKIQYTQHVPLIKGWISVLGKMNGGDKVTVLIPSSMAYGAHGQGQIPAYTPLIFDIEVVNIIPKK